MIRPRALAMILLAFLVVDGGITAIMFPRDVVFSIALWGFATALAIVALSALMHAGGMKEKSVLVVCVVALCLLVLAITVFAGASGHIAVIALATILIVVAAGCIIEGLTKLLASPAQTG